MTEEMKSSLSVRQQMIYELTIEITRRGEVSGPAAYEEAKTVVDRILSLEENPA